VTDGITITNVRFYLFIRFMYISYHRKTLVNLKIIFCIRCMNYVLIQLYTQRVSLETLAAAS